MQIGVCHDICVPVTLTFAADLPPDGRRDPGIVAAMVDQPMPADRAGVQGVTCHAEPTEDGLRLTAHLTLPRHRRDRSRGHRGRRSSCLGL